ncbi:MAG TPA: hypothetical protein PLM33_08740, partial [Acidobacteriota bacterium]|nr:hypothetical protein [Acidobacteriota bacterium]
MTRSNQVRNVRDASGYLDLHDKGYGFLRSLERGFEPHRDDAFVEPSLIRELGLRPGHFVTGLAGDGYR